MGLSAGGVFSHCLFRDGDRHGHDRRPAAFGTGVSEADSGQFGAGHVGVHVDRLVVAVLAGMTLFVSDPRMYTHNSSFRFKMTALIVAIIYHYTVHHKVVSSNSSDRKSR